MSALPADRGYFLHITGRPHAVGAVSCVLSRDRTPNLLKE